MNNRLLYKIFLGVFVTNVLTSLYLLFFVQVDIGWGVLMLGAGISALIFLGLSILFRFFKKDIYLAVKIIFLVIGGVSFLMSWYVIFGSAISNRQRLEHFKRVEEAEQKKNFDECEQYKLKLKERIESQNSQSIPPNNIPTPPPGCI